MGVQMRSRAIYASLVYLLLAGYQVIQIHLYLCGPPELLDTTISRTYSHWQLFNLWVVDDVAPRCGTAGAMSAQAKLQLSLALNMAGVVVLTLCDLWLGARFLLVGLLWALPVATVMPGPDPWRSSSISFMIVTFQVVWYLLLLTACSTALSRRQGVKDFIFSLPVAGFLATLLVPLACLGVEYNIPAGMMLAALLLVYGAKPLLPRRSGTGQGRANSQANGR